MGWQADLNPKDWLSSLLVSLCPASPTGYQIAYRLASSRPHTFTTVEVGATVRQFTATELAPESAYVFRLSAKTRQGWGEPLEATVITTEKRGKPFRPNLMSWQGQKEVVKDMWLPCWSLWSTEKPGTSLRNTEKTH